MPANLRADVLSFSLPRISRVVDGGEGYSESQEAIAGWEGIVAWMSKVYVRV